ncbi:mitogen-activated protein kinase kinase kinase 7-like [Dysidea avara]|uniref:mitogen-activated protein kinase kinase kinase 7-like n=1 Tax=Dysidea avara TaxID=196820 RepID=UPI00332D4F4C
MSEVMSQCPAIRVQNKKRPTAEDEGSDDLDGNVTDGKRPRIRRANTVAEKQKMKRDRKARKRQRKKCGAAEVVKQLYQAKLDHDKTKNQLAFNQKLAQLYWDRWRHEVQERKCRRVLPLRVNLPVIPRSSLHDTEKGVVGRGSFGVVKHMMYRGIDVAVKTFDSDCSNDSVICEASFLSKLQHPNLPLFFGCNTVEQPPYIVVQFYGICGKSITIHKELASPIYITTVEEWLLLCKQLSETVKYLHDAVHCLHNDIKSDNVLLTDGQVTNQSSGNYSVVLIDFNKATRLSDGKQYTLSPYEKTLHYTHHPHLAPEVIEGTSKQTCASDMFAVGRLLKQIAKRMQHNTSDDTAVWSRLQSIASHCTSQHAESRPSAEFLADDIKKLLTIT